MKVKWWVWALVVAAVGLAVYFLPWPFRKTGQRILGRVRLREQESQKRLYEVELQDAISAAKQAQSEQEATRARLRAREAGQRASQIENERKALAESLVQDIADEERARRFRERHGLTHPSDPS